MPSALSKESAARIEALFEFICSKVGQITPRSVDMANAIGCTAIQAENAVTYLKRHARIKAEGLGDRRVLIVPGVGETIAHGGNRPRAAYLDTPVEAVTIDEPVRVASWSCPRCGARSGHCPHTTVALTVSDRAGWQRYAGA